ncbi:MAG: ribonuclease III, partial [Clostridiales bacterium 43-6]
MKELEQKIGYTFQNKGLLKKAVTHSSYANEAKEKNGSNERLEFLGDAVLSIIISDFLYKNYNHLPEGELTKLRASLVCEKSLFGFSKQLDLGSFLRLGKGEKQTGGSERSSILADAFEAVLAAIYLDGGIESASKFVMGFANTELLNTKQSAFID